MKPEKKAVSASTAIWVGRDVYGEVAELRHATHGSSIKTTAEELLRIGIKVKRTALKREQKGK